MEPKPVDMRIGSIQVQHEILIQDFDKRRESTKPCAWANKKGGPVAA
jgi:hypothetical protein